MTRGTRVVSLVCAVTAVGTVLAGCKTSGSSSEADAYDPLVGWFKLADGETIIPVFKRDGTYYSVCRGFEAPFKESPEGLEWAFSPSSMVGTTIGIDEGFNSYYIVVKDRQRPDHPEDPLSNGERLTLTKIDKPSGLHDPAAPAPQTNDDFVGAYQGFWWPARFEIRKDGGGYLYAEVDTAGPDSGTWKTRVIHEIRPLSDGLGLTGFNRGGGVDLVYNDPLRRFEITKSGGSHILRMPLVRVSPSERPEDEAVLRQIARIGIPSWH